MKTLLKTNPILIDKIIEACEAHGATASVRTLSSYGFSGFGYAISLGLGINDKVIEVDGLRSETIALLDGVIKFVRV